MVGKLAVQRLLRLKEDIANQGYTSETWQQWREFRRMQWMCGWAAAFSTVALLAGGYRIALTLGK
jgi:hypothetical protein